MPDSLTVSLQLCDVQYNAVPSHKLNTVTNVVVAKRTACFARTIVVALRNTRVGSRLGARSVVLARRFGALALAKRCNWVLDVRIPQHVSNHCARLRQRLVPLLTVGYDI